MYIDDLSLLCCPKSRAPLELAEDHERAADGEILEGILASPSGDRYPIRGGIPRFVDDPQYNASWDYKWTEIDQGRGLNYRITDPNDPAYRLHDLFDRNNHEGRAYRRAAGGIALDIGCGVGQYSWRLLEEAAPRKVVALDLTRGVDLFRRIMLERFPQHRQRILMVQASVFAMPFRDETFDYVFSLGVLMHTGDTRTAISQAARVVQPGGQLNIWVYGAVPVHIDVREQGRKVPMDLLSFIPYQFYTLWVMAQINLFRRLPRWLVVKVLRLVSSDRWYRLCSLPVVGYGFRIVFGTVMHPDQDYRYINNYDGWCNTWADTWTEQELFPVLRDAGIAIKGISAWQTGIWGEKIKGFYG